MALYMALLIFFLLPVLKTQQRHTIESAQHRYQLEVVNLHSTLTTLESFLELVHKKG